MIGFIFKYLKFLFHPILIVGGVTYLSCLPMDLAEEVFDEFPLVGENIRTPESPVVYHFDGNEKHVYLTEGCYFSMGNPPFNVHFSRGGIKFVTQRVLELIPDGEAMCSGKTFAKSKKVWPVIPTDLKNLTKKNFLLANFSDVAHLLSYFLIAISTLLFLFRNPKNAYLLSFFFVLLFGGLLELVQHFFVPGRMADWHDMLLNLCGGGIGILCWHWLVKRWLVNQTETKM